MTADEFVELYPHLRPKYATLCQWRARGVPKRVLAAAGKDETRGEDVETWVAFTPPVCSCSLCRERMRNV